MKPCTFFSRKFSPAERNYDVGNRELLAIKWAFEEWRHWLEGAKHRVVVLTDHKNLTYLESAKRLNPRQARWSLFFARFDFVISYLPGSKNVKADALSRSFVPDSLGLSEPAGILKEGTNGQTERTNQTLETYLRCFVSADQDDCVSFLPLAEFALNNRVSSATLVSPFFCNSGFHPRFSSGQVESSDCPGVDTVVDRLQQIWTHVVDNLTLSQEKAQRFANRRRCVGPRLRVGDLVWLSSRHIPMKVSSPKFKPRLIGPYRISEVLNPVSFRLTLPDSFSIHNVFHRSLSRRYVAPMVPSVDPPAPVLVEGELEYIVEKILDSRVSRRKLQYLVKWKGYAQEDNSWVFASDVHAPDLVRAFHMAHPGRPGGSGLSSALRVKILAEVGKHVSFPCNKPPNGDIEWFKEQKLLGCRNNRRFFGPGAKDQQRYNDPCHEANDLVVSDLRTADSGTYTFSIVPSANLLPSEDLELNLTPSSVPGLKVSWKKDGMAMSNDPKLEENNVQSNAVYECRITMAGFHDFPSIVYASDKSPVTIPWIFKFNIRKNPMSSDAHVEEGSISYSSQILSRLSVTDGAASWPRKSDEKEASEKPNDLSIHLTKPKSGKYQMEILLKIGKRRKELRREVCVAGLTVSNSESAVSMDTKVPLHCAINCMESNKKLCWHQMKTNRETCGRDGQSSVNVEVTAGNETKTAWTCSVTDGKNRIISVNVTLSREGDSDLTGQSAFLDLSNSRFWAAVGVGIFILILIVVIITLVIARHRRMVVIDLVEEEPTNLEVQQISPLIKVLEEGTAAGMAAGELTPEKKIFAPQRLKTTSDYI
ncbi:unnamed protein product [Ranitomeya imitator]|uniref:Chromo domain-containing protein n=1 Tax=Ranitomeya imitator TaxID=111125 RepID=A0ABN9MH46_9NEOB|nr:unnamed protein product [Ranitomeya imitator]